MLHSVAKQHRLIPQVASMWQHSFISAPVRAVQCRALIRHWAGMLYGLVAILAITPCFGFIMLLLPLRPAEFSTGLALFCVVPTTLGVGVALTAASKGNQALALLLTVVTNLLGIVTVSKQGIAFTSLGVYRVSGFRTPAAVPCGV